MRSPVVVLLVIGGVLVAAAGLGYALLVTPVQQPIAFSHRLHVEELGAECTDCHLYATTGMRATIPNIEICANCHEEAQTESLEEAKVVEHIQAGRKIPWSKVNWVPDHVYFSHRRHTTIAAIECETCHGSMKDRQLPVDRPAVSLAMNDCIRCHETAGASTDCLHCHR